MLRYLSLAVLLCIVSVAIAAPTVVVNGKVATITASDVDGKALVDIVALMQLLGGKATYDAAAGKIYVSSTAGGGAPAGGTKNLANFGTPQLPGDNGQIGQVYKLRNASPVYFRLNSAEYTVSQVPFSKAIIIPQADEKLLVLHFSVQNPQNTEQLFRFDSLHFTAVDAMNVNHEAKSIGDEQTKEDLQIHLKPAQRIEGYTTITVPAKGVIPKLMVLPPVANDGPVLRYDLRDIASPLPAPIADPADPSGATALEVVPAQLGAAYPLRYFDATVEKYETVDTALDAAAPKNGETYFVVTLSVKNKAALESLLRFDTIKATLKDANGLELKYRNLLAAGADVGFSQKVPADGDVRVRMYFAVPKGAKPATLSIREATSRTYQYDVSQ